MSTHLVEGSITRATSMPLYDSLRVSTSISAGDNRLFTDGLGSTANGFTSGKQINNTNIQRGGGIPMQASYRCTSFGVFIRQLELTATSGTSAAAQSAALDCQNIAGLLCLQLIQGANVRTYGPLGFFPGGGGMAGTTVGDDGGISSEVANWVNVNGVPAAGARYQLEYPIDFREGESFTWNVNCPVAYTLISSSNSYDVTVAMWGTQYQEVIS